MNRRVNFTADRVAHFRFRQSDSGKANQTVYWDAKTPGLGLRVTAGGAKSYIFESRLHGKTVRLTIGDVRTWSIGKAQDEATRLKSLTDQGLDPRQQRKEQAAAAEAFLQEKQRKELSVDKAWNAYIRARTPKWGEVHLRNHQNMVKAGGEKRTRGRRKGEPDTVQPGPLHCLLSLRLSDLDSDKVKGWLEPLAARTPTQAAQTYRALRAFIGWCADHKDYRELVHAEACNRRIAREILPKAKAKADCLQREQLEGWFQEVRKIHNPTIAAYLQVILLTGARRTEMAELQWQDVDFRWQSLSIRDKVEGERVIPLTPYVAALLADLKRRNETPPRIKILRSKKADTPADEPWKPSPWVFSSPTAKSGRLQEPRIQHRRACTAAGIVGLTLHGLRRSFSTLTEWVECPAGVVAQIMGHKPSATAEKHYTVRPLDLLRVHHERIEAWILEQAGIKFDAKTEPGKLRVVPG